MKIQERLVILRDREVYALTKLSKSTRWRLERNGQFPKKVQLSANTVGWFESEIEDWLRSRVAEGQQGL